MNEEERKEDLFRNKRRMAWVGFGFIFVIGCTGFFVAPKSKEVVDTALWIFASLTASYMGLSTAADFFSKTKGK